MEGVASERAAWFWQTRGNGRLAHMYWQQAYGCFARWGARSKLQKMEVEYRKWLAADLPATANTEDPHAQEIPDAILEKQIGVLRCQALRLAESRKLEEMQKFAGELAPAAERLRAEVAERKKVEQALRASEE